MKLSWLNRLPAVCGAIYVVLALSEGGGDDSAPTIASGGQQIARYAAAHPIASGTYYVGVAALLALLVFTVALQSALKRTEPGGAIASTVVLGAGILAVAVKLSSLPAVYALYSSPTPIDASVARALWVLGEFAFVLVMLAQALMLGAAAASGLMHGGIPRWLAATAGVIAVALPVGVAVAGKSDNFLAELLWLAWVLVASVTLAIRAPRSSVDGVSVQDSESGPPVRAAARP